MHSFDVFHRYERTLWCLKDIPWETIDRANIDEADIRFVRAAVMGEATFMGGLHTFLNGALDNFDLACFASIWSYQELQHHLAFRRWLKAVDADVAQAPIDAMGTPFPTGKTLSQTLASNIVGELVVCHVYLNVAERTREPVLAQLLRSMSGDEGRHAQAFAHYVKRRLETNPEELVSVLETLYFYAGNKAEPVRHPSSVFKGELPPELAEHDTIDNGLEYFASLDGNKTEVLRQRVFRTFASLTGLELTDPRSVRRELVAALDRDRARAARLEARAS